MDPIAFPWVEPFPQDYIRFVQILEEDAVPHAVPDATTDGERYFALVYPTDTGVTLIKSDNNTLHFQMEFSCFERIFTSEIPAGKEWIRSSTNQILLSISHGEENEFYATKMLDGFRTGWALSHTFVNCPPTDRKTPYSCLILTEEAKHEILRLYLNHCS
jgi:hypothetical protein